MRWPRIDTRWTGWVNLASGALTTILGLHA